MKALGTSLVILSLTMAQLRHNLILVSLLVFLLTPLLSYGQPSTDATGNVDAIGNPGVSGNPNVVNPALADDPGPQPVAPTPISEAEATKKKPGAAPGKNVIPTTPTEMIIALHYWSIPFILCTLIVVSFSVERLVMLRRGRVIPKPFVDRFLLLVQEGKLSPDEALELCIENNSPIAQIFEHGVKKWGKPSVEVEQAIIDGGERQVGHLRKHLRWLNGISNITPLIGLLGTVWGLIESFNTLAITKGAAGTEGLASGMAVALLTTAVGLGIAIPSLVIYMYFAGRIDKLVMDMDDLAQILVNSISAESLQGLTPTSNKSKSKTSRSRPKEAS
jgi:biopolymer transport protein ExbB